MFFENCDDPLFDPYREMRHRNWTWRSGIFIAEGPLLVDRLLQSSYGIHSILVEERYAEKYERAVPDNVPILVVPHAVVEQLVGFNFHRGVLACGFRKPLDGLPPDCTTMDLNETWLGLFSVNDPENLGGMLRTAAGLGICKILIGPGTADPLSRRALRVSMGNALFLEIYQVHQATAALAQLQSQGFEVIATALTEEARSLETAQRSGPLILLMGNERHGLAQEILDVADRCVRIDMKLGTDSLNVGVAAGITMHHFCRVAKSMFD